MKNNKELKIVSAKIPTDLFDKIEEVKERMGIETRNELVERALRLYVCSFHHAVRSVNEYNNLKEARST